MKQKSPLRKGDKHFEAIHAYINKPTPEQIDAKQRVTDQCDCTDPTQCWEPCGELGHSEEHVHVYQPSDAMQEIMQGFVGGTGLGAAGVAVGAWMLGASSLFNLATLIVVICLLGYIWLGEKKS